MTRMKKGAGVREPFRWKGGDDDGNVSGRRDDYHRRAAVPAYFFRTISEPLTGTPHTLPL